MSTSSNSPTPTYSPEYLSADHGSKLIHVAALFVVLEFLFVGLYLTSRVRSKRAEGWDLYLMLPAFMSCLSPAIVSFIFVKAAGLGHHMAALSPNQLNIMMKLMFVMEFTNPPAITLPKLTILILYLRIFTLRVYRVAAYAIAAILVATWATGWIALLTVCKPVAYQWDKSIAGGHCLTDTPKGAQIFIWFSIPSIVTDVAMLILPLPVIWRLQMSIHQKIGLTITFITGSVGLFTSILRFSEFLKYYHYSDKGVTDFPWYGLELILWSTVEPGVYLIAACLPSLRPLFRGFFNSSEFKSFGSIFGYYRSKLSSNDIESTNGLALGFKANQPRPPPHFDFDKYHEPGRSGSSGDDHMTLMNSVSRIGTRKTDFTVNDS